MAIETYFNNEVFIQTLYVNTISIPSGSITDASVAAGAAISASKTVNRYYIPYSQEDGSNTASTSGEGVGLYTCRTTNGTTIEKVVAWCPDVGSGGAPAHNIAVEVKKYDWSGTSLGTILSSAINITEAQADYADVEGTLSDTDMDTGDKLMLQVTVTGSGGTAMQGLHVGIIVAEEPT